MCLKSVIRNFILPGIDRLNAAFEQHVDAVKSIPDCRQPPAMHAGQSVSFMHVNGLKDIQ